ncbi:hypothetical protein QJ857_gp1162 [Tupanvirus soda lake]|uniref:Uncharacterized protein n=2 Tax=Tupanvirus TaxID=2094720 RepID=A0A6N1NXI4_9VIRU|nr:hypothetical protein QJ857_gp1162 [Tupanvirus soda lake]QKU34892.1 hypothetical protein [Tupanvirus soda lake]
MPRGKKSQETNTRKNKKIVEDEEQEDENLEDEILEDEEESTPKKKSSKKTAPKNKPKKGKKADAEDEDELSDLDVDDEDDAPAIESAENDKIVSSQKHERPPIKVIDPKTPIGNLKTDDVLSYLIQVGTETLNPQLKYGALNLLKQLTGRRRRHPPPTYGSKSNRNFNNRGGFSQRGGRGGRNSGPRNQSRSQANNSAEDLYGETD